MAVRPKREISVRHLAPVALMPVGAFAVHQLRYWLAFGHHASAVLQAQGHHYLHSAVPWIVVLIALAVGLFLRALGRVFGGHTSLPRYTASFMALWLACAASLIAIYAAQELLEGWFATGHPGGLAGVFGYGGWWSVPAAVAVGLVLAAVFHGARWILAEVARRSAVQTGWPRARLAPVRPRTDVFLAPLAPVADGWSGRGPPR
jgi:hypothetical protein